MDKIGSRAASAGSVDVGTVESLLGQAQQAVLLFVVNLSLCYFRTYMMRQKLFTIIAEIFNTVSCNAHALGQGK